MCGIIGVTGAENAPEVMIEALSRLEYRGYDSAGIVVFQDGGFKRVREATGTHSVDLLRKQIGELRKSLSISGIGHNRWATHGKPTQENAHPHLDCTDRIAIVHNGIVENFAELKSGLIERSHTFESETDTEVVAHLLEEEMEHSGDISEALRSVFPRLRGSMALLVMSADDPSTLACVRRSNPLIIGTKGEEGFVASDIPAILGEAERYFKLEDDIVVRLNGSEILARDLSGRPVQLEEFTVNWSMERAERGGFEDFMSKEILEQPAAVRDTLAGRIDGSAVVDQLFDESRISAAELASIDKVVIIGCGSSYHAGMVARYAIERFCKIPVELDFSSEFRYRDLVLNEKTLVVAVSQSGETLDSIVALTEAAHSGAKTLSVTNIVGSSMARLSDAVLYTHAGPEICVAATKTHLAQIAALELLAAHLAVLRGSRTPELDEFVAELALVPMKLERLVAGFNEMVATASGFETFERFYFIARNMGYPVALEGALKLKEISYLPAEAFPAGELKHGPIAMIDEGSVVVAVANRTPLWEKVMSNIAEVRARGARVLVIADEGDLETIRNADVAFEVPRTHPLLTPLLAAVPLQVLAYHLARYRGNNVDRPRNLAKTVTVE
ncbi:MAG: glutamine--fructose-6-phosphate transaminase (isomerizing) [Acidimicrobiaceae bacterium]|nr:glutamine--fructose-6-phosphate transaminase (isomerizing) [Acidimicrobiaceae bacterium]